MRSFGPQINSLAITSFCLLPPERAPAEVSILGVLTSNFSTSFVANARIAPVCLTPALENSFSSNLFKTELSATE